MPENLFDETQNVNENELENLNSGVDTTATNSGGFDLGFDFGGLFDSGVPILFYGVLGFFVVSIISLILKKLLYDRKKNEDWKKTVFLDVRIPIETLEQIQKESNETNKQEKDVIAVGEQLFHIISEYAKEPVIHWLTGSERFSFEIVSVDQEISFWIVCGEEVASVVERQVVALYPKANITQLKETNFFKEKTVAYAQELTLENRYELPFRTYNLMEKEPLNTLSNALTGLAKNESAAIQLVLTPIQDGWQKKPRFLASKMQQGMNPQEILNPSIDIFKYFGKVVEFIFSIFSSDKKDDFNPHQEERKIDLSGKREAVQLTPQQQEILKGLEDKAAKPGFTYALRIIGSSDNEARAKQIVDNIIPSFQVFDARPFNNFKRKSTSSKDSIMNFLLRSPYFWPTQVINSEEVTSIWHLPNYLVQNSSIKWLQARKPAIPLGIPGSGPGNVFIGTAKSGNQTKDVYLKTEDRFRHIYALGGSGSGKSVFMTNLILQDIEMGNGACVVDPHGETVDDVLLRMPKERADDVIVFSPAMTDRPLGLNMLETDPLKPAQKTVVIDTLFQIWDKLYDLQKTGGPMFEQYMKNAMRLVMSHPASGSTLMEINKVLSDEDYRSFKLAMCEEEEVVDFWEKTAMKAGGEASLENIVPYIVSKLAPFVSNDFIRPMIGQQKSAIDFRQAMDNKKVVLVKLEKGLIGETSAYLVGMVVIGNILLAGMGRNDGLKYNLDGTTSRVLKDDRPPFFVYIDEMQNFLFDAIPKALEEIRKYKVGFCLAHQFVKQVVKQGDERIKDSIMANTASKFIFRAGAEDAEMLAKEFAPTLSPQDLQNPERFTCNSIVLIDGQKTSPFNIAPPALNDQIDVEFRDKLIQDSMIKYGKTREEVEKDIKERVSKFLF
jgi:hypothetical protein